MLLGGGAGVLVQSLGSAEAPPPGPPPAALLAAIRAERTLIADLDATTGGSTHVRRLVVQVRADHVAHLRALRALLPAFRRPRTAEDGRPVGTPRTLAHLRAAEQHASLAAAGHASALDGAYAALLASIAACEAAHAELLR